MHCCWIIYLNINVIIYLYFETYIWVSNRKKKNYTN